MMKDIEKSMMIKSFTTLQAPIHFTLVDDKIYQNFSSNIYFLNISPYSPKVVILAKQKNWDFLTPATRMVE